MKLIIFINFCGLFLIYNIYLTYQLFFSIIIYLKYLRYIQANFYLFFFEYFLLTCKTILHFYISFIIISIYIFTLFILHFLTSIIVGKSTRLFTSINFVSNYFLCKNNIQIKLSSTYSQIKRSI